MIFVFDNCVLDTGRRELRRGASVVSVQPQVFDLLEFLIRNRGRVMSRNAVLDAIWHGRLVSESTLATRINAARSAIGDDGRCQRLIQTFPRVGFRFIGEVHETQEERQPTRTGISPLQVPVGVDPQIDAERRHLTVLSCDFIGLRELATQLDPEELRSVIRSCYMCCSEVAARWAGSVASFADDAATIHFSFPQAHEDDAERAVRAGLEILARVKSPEICPGNSLSARLGAATGIVVIGSTGGAGTVQDGLAFGETPALAAALRRVAAPGSIIIASSTRDLLGSLFEYEAVGPFAIEGLPGQLKAWRVISPRPAESRFEAQRKSGLVPFVGREEELALLLRWWREARTGNGRVGLISGEPGIGKSRIMVQLAERLQDQERYTRLQYQCSPHYRDSALHPFIVQMERFAALASDDPPGRRLEKLEAALAIPEPRRQKALPLLATLLSIPIADSPQIVNPMQHRHETLSALVDQLDSLARRQPVLLMFEDAHWADPTSIELLDLIVERIRRLPILALITFRPEFEPSWAGLPNIGAVALGRLDQHDVRAMVERLARGHNLPTRFMEQIVARAEGVPLFVEELTKCILESDQLTKAEPGLRRASPASSIAIPFTLQDSLTGRLDRLGPAKQIAQVCAVIGRDFSYALLAAVARRPEAELLSALDSLTRADLLFRLGEPPHASYLFKHALVQEAAYGTLLREPRRALHARIAETIEGKFPRTAENQPELLAHHCTEAGLIEKASSFWGTAGQRSLERSALLEAVVQLSRALEQIATLPTTPALRRREIKFQVALANALMHVKSYAAPESKAAMERARILIEQASALGEPPEDPLLLYSALYGIWAANNVAFDGGAVRELADQFLALAEVEQATVPLMVGHRIMGYSRTLTGDFAQARAHFDRAIRLYDPAEHRPLLTRFSVDVGVTVLTYRSLALWILGYPDSALTDTKEALRNVEIIGNAATSMYALVHAALTHIQCGDYSAAAAATNKSIALAEEKGASFWKAMGILAWGCILALTGEASNAIQTITFGINSLRSTGATYFAPTHLSFLTRAYAELGQFDDAWRCIDEAMMAIETSRETWWQAEVYRIAGEITLMSSHPDVTNAQAHFQRALAVARDQQAKSWELRAAMSTARLWSKQGKRDEAHDLLAPLFDWFTEGFDTRDLKEAKTLLNQLRA